MFAKLLTLLTQLKAAGITAVVIAGAATVTVAGTSPQFQQTFQQLTGQVAGNSSSTDCEHGQPAIVAQRNSADKLLRAAAQKDQKALEDLRGGKGQDNQAVGVIVKKYDDLLRMRLDKALNDVAAQTLGRDGQNKGSASPKPSASASPSTSPSGSASPAPSCSPAPSASASPSTSASASPKASESPEASGSGKPAQEGRVTVAERTTLDANIQSIVDLAIKDMDGFVTVATAEVAAVPSPDHGKPSDNPGNKPSDAGKPSASPKH